MEKKEICGKKFIELVNEYRKRENEKNNLKYYNEYVLKINSGNKDEEWEERNQRIVDDEEFILKINNLVSRIDERLEHTMFDRFQKIVKLTQPIPQTFAEGIYELYILRIKSMMSGLYEFENNPQEYTKRLNQIHEACVDLEKLFEVEIEIKKEIEKKITNHNKR